MISHLNKKAYSHIEVRRNHPIHSGKSPCVHVEGIGSEAELKMKTQLCLSPLQSIRMDAAGSFMHPRMMRSLKINSTTQ